MGERPISSVCHHPLMGLSSHEAISNMWAGSALLFFRDFLIYVKDRMTEVGRGKREKNKEGEYDEKGERRAG